MNGPPAKPISGTSSSSASDADRLDDVGGVDLGLERPQALQVVLAGRKGSATTGPVPGATSTPKPMAAAGTTMSEKKMAASVP